MVSIAQVCRHSPADRAGGDLATALIYLEMDMGGDGTSVSTAHYPKLALLTLSETGNQSIADFVV